MSQNGLDTYAMHADENADGALVGLEAGSGGPAAAAEGAAVDPETAARGYLDRMIASPSVPTLTESGPGDEMDYRLIGTETVGLTGATVVKFAQQFHRIPVYGSLITVELDDDNSLLAMNSAVGMPAGVDPAASVSPAQAQATVLADAEVDHLDNPPRLYFYFDNRAEPATWRLVHIAKDVLRRRGSPNGAGTAAIPELVDYVIDAHTGELLARIPRTQSVAWTAEEADELDALGISRRVRLERDEDGNLRLVDPVRNVRTYDFAYADAAMSSGLPGNVAANPPDPWSTAAISAHANAAAVADFLSTVLRRNGLDNRGGAFVSSINCTYQNPSPGNKEWRNAAWIGTQMIYGQRIVDGTLRSYALARDVVAHEIIHGLTDKTARLEYERESGALNESYSDIFGIIVSNSGDPASTDVSTWNWEMGEDLDLTGVPIRDLQDPKRRGQPDHMDDFKRLQPGEAPGRRNDWGWLHHNSGIHNKAGYDILTSRTDGTYTFTPDEVAGLFYLALTQYLSRTSGFTDSRRGVELAARTLFRGDRTVDRERKLAAIAAAFDAAGIR